MSIERMKSAKFSTRCDIEPELWLDYVEGSLDESLYKDLTLHAAQCLVCKTHLSEINLVRKYLKPLHPRLPDDLFFKKLENKIMASVDKTHVETVVPMGRRHVKTAAMATAAMLVMVLGMPFLWPKFGSSGLKKQTKVAAHMSEEQMIWQNAIHNPEVFGNTIMSHQDSDDFVLEAAAEKLSIMSDKEVRTALDKMK